jgi:hypothetical protein
MMKPFLSYHASFSWAAYSASKISTKSIRMDAKLWLENK